ncbi:MAG: 4-hydroxybutyrate dehydrogenase [Lachnospiraceae bacterium]|nr:4-hydroxybutyrate dehydrogenase [Lachnospiraceae bacterium]
MMKAFQIVPAIAEYEKFADFARGAGLGSNDLILTNEYIYRPVISELGLGCETIFQEKFGVGEPTDEMVDAILNELREKEYGRIIAVGGGTVIDIAKVLAVAAPGDKVDDLYDRMAEGLVKIHPLLIVPTTCGTGSEVTNISIINKVSKGVKQGIVSSAMFADEAALIPEMLMSLPYGVFATSSIDAMVHAVESYLSPNACALSELFSVEAIHFILKGWKRALEKGGTETWKESALEFLRASNYAGIAFGYAGCAAVHAMAYPLGSVHHIPHGQANQLMFAEVMKKYVQKQPKGKLENLEAVLGEELGVAAKAGLDRLYRLMDDVLKCTPLREHGIKEEELPVFAKNVVETQQRLLNNNYVALTEGEILEIYRGAF